MTRFFEKEIALGPRSIVTLLLTPLSELGLSQNACRFLKAKDVEYCFHLLTWSRKELFKKVGNIFPDVWIGRLTPIAFELKRIMWRLENYGFRIGMCCNYTRILFEEVLTEMQERQREREKKSSRNNRSLGLGYGNHHPAFPTSERQYNGSIPHGEW